LAGLVVIRSSVLSDTIWESHPPGCHLLCSKLKADSTKQDGAIHSAAGPSLLHECRALNGCSTGSAKITSAHALPSKYIIHAVGPIYYRAKRQSEDRPAELLTSCYRTSLQLAAEKGGSIAFSCLSTGVYGYPSGEAAAVAAREVRRFLEEDNEGRLERVVLCCFEAKDERAYGEWLPYVMLFAE